jgi:hypothetical protein
MASLRVLAGRGIVSGIVTSLPLSVNQPFTSWDELPDHWIRAKLSESPTAGVFYGHARSPSRIADVVDESWVSRAKVTDVTGDEAALFESADGRVLLAIHAFPKSPYFNLVVLDESGAESAELIGRALLKKARPAKPAPPTAIDVDFWSNSQHGPQSRRRRIDAPAWGEVATNYPPAASVALDELMRRSPGTLGTGAGRLILMHGPPGTGKTSAIRALAREWKPWCDVHYVVDPEGFFGNASYMLEVLLANEASSDDDDEDEEAFTWEPVSQEFVATPVKREAKPGPRWRVVVVEDADEFLRTDSKDRIGQALSRLLNVGDGLVGQGLRVLVLLTTNARSMELNPAIVRPGRCLANIEVPAFTAAEATAWLSARGQAGTRLATAEEHTLAALYERLREARKIEAAVTPARTGQYL